MSMKLFWKHVLPRLLLIMLPIAAVQAQYTDKVQTDFSTITAVADTGAAEAGTALKILTITDGTNAYLHWSEAGATGLSNTPWTNGENIGNINATFEANQYGTGGSVGLIIADNFVTPINFAGQILDVGTIDVTSEASNTKPLVGLQLVGGPTAGSPKFLVKLNVGNVTVINKGTAATSKAEGVGLWDANFEALKIGNTAVINIGDITVESASAYTDHDVFSYGFSADSILADGSVTLGDVNVTSAGQDANGVFVRQSVLGGLSIGEVNVKVTDKDNEGRAVGIKLGAGNVTEDTSVTISRDVVAESAGGYARAIEVSTSASASLDYTVTLNTNDGDLKVVGKGANTDQSAGIRFSNGSNDYANTTLVIEGANTFTNKGENFVVRGAKVVQFDTDVDIVGGSFQNNTAVGGVGSIAFEAAENKHVKLGNTDITAYATAGTVDFATGKDSVIQTNGVVSAANLKVKGAGRVELGGDIAAAGTTVGLGTDSVTLAINAEKMTANGLGQLLVNTGATLEVHGNNNNTLSLAGSVNNGTIITKNSVGKWDIDGGGQLKLLKAAKASISDGVLAAAAIHGRHTAWNAVRDHLISGYADDGNQGFLGQAPLEAYEILPPFAFRTAWVNYIGRADSYQNSYTGGKWNITSNGIQVGSDLYRTDKSQFGVLFGYEAAKAKEALDNIDADDIYVGLYASHIFCCGVDVRAILNYGWQDFTSNRYVGTANTAKYGANTLEVNLEAGKRIFFGNWSVRPVTAVDLYWNKLNAATETGTNAVAYDRSDFTQTFVRFGSDLRYEFGSFTFNSGVYYSWDTNNDELETRVSAAGLSSTLSGSKLGRSLLTFNVGGEYAFGAYKNFSIFGGFTGDAALDRDGDGFQSVGYVGGAWKW